jgi:UPF0716 family protein affecting phage T7 exclusion
VTPGLVTDCTGFLLLIPPFRDVVRNTVVRRWLGNATVVTTANPFPAGRTGAPTPPSSRPPREGEIIDVEAEVLEGDDTPTAARK